MKNTEKMISEFLEQIEKDKVLATEKLNAMEEQRCVMDRERSEISKAVIRLENEGDQEAVQKLTKELSKRVNEISVLDSKIEAYKEMGNNYEAEAEKVFALAAKEFNEDQVQREEKCREEISKAEIEVKEAKKVLEEKSKILEEKESTFSSVKYDKRRLIESQLPKIMKYMPRKIRELNPNVKVTVPTKVPGGTVYRDNYVEFYGQEGLEAQLSYYYQKVLNGDGKESVPKRKSVVDKILGR